VDLAGAKLADRSKKTKSRLAPAFCRSDETNLTYSRLRRQPGQQELRRQLAQQLVRRRLLRQKLAFQ
jgi:hypothetical protein